MFSPALHEALSASLNNKIEISKVIQVFGGDINKCYKLQTNSGSFFVKMNSREFPGMFQKEFNGLMKLKSANAVKVPRPVLVFEQIDTQYLVLDWQEKGPPSKNFWKDFAASLACQHKTSGSRFGLEEDNYIGTIPQSNSWCGSWHEFYSDQRILALMKKAAAQQKCEPADIDAAESLCKKLGSIFPPEPPALLHGDLWGGNYMVDEKGDAVIFDPAVYYGHREMDLAMTLLFGGFDQTFYKYYDEAYPLEKNWKERVELCQLYPLLVHLLLFGGHYYNSVKSILRRYA